LGHLVVIDDKPLDDNAMFRLILAIFSNRVGAEIERQRMEETMRTHQARLAHLDRLHSMGEMATGIAHELNQPLTAISNYANGAALRLKRGNGVDAHLQDALSEISKQARRAGGIISRMRAFVAKREPAMTSVDLNEVATEAMRLCQFRAKRSRVRILTELTQPLPLVCGDAVQLEQVILNLLLNAVEALEENDASPRTVIIATGTRDGQVALEVRDTGPGLPPGIEDIVFDQFVTTKLDGLGLGLPISRSIIRAHGGQLVGENHPDGGARFWFTLDEVDGPCHE
jgi:C4-dicarboxylate-specific signal transduction histidine kinase